MALLKYFAPLKTKTFEVTNSRKFSSSKVSRYTVYTPCQATHLTDVKFSSSPESPPKIISQFTLTLVHGDTFPHAYIYILFCFTHTHTHTNKHPPPPSPPHSHTHRWEAWRKDSMTTGSSRYGLLMQRRRIMLSGSCVHCQRPVKLRSRNIRYTNDIIPITHSA